MGCDIHAHAERKNEQGAWVRIDMDTPLGGREYGKFGLLAGVRNYSAIPPIAEPRGMPSDASPETKEDFDGWSSDAHSASWLAVDELLAVDYQQTIEDRRCIRQTGPNSWSGGETCAPGEGKHEKLADFLGPHFLNKLTALKEAGAERVVFWFDN